MLLKSPIDTMPGVCSPAVTIGDAIKTVKNSAVMRGMHFWIVRQPTGYPAFAIGRKDMMKNLIGSDPAFRCGFVQSFIVVGHDVPFSEHEIGMVAGLIAPGEARGDSGGAG